VRGLALSEFHWRLPTPPRRHNLIDEEANCALIYFHRPSPLIRKQFNSLTRRALFDYNLPLAKNTARKNTYLCFIAPGISPEEANLFGHSPSIVPGAFITIVATRDPRLFFLQGPCYLHRD